MNFTADTFKEFDSQKLGVWMMTYLTDEAKESYKFDIVNLVRKKVMSEDELQHWREILAENFDYEKYESLKE